MRYFPGKAVTLGNKLIDCMWSVGCLMGVLLVSSGLIACNVSAFCSEHSVRDS